MMMKTITRGQMIGALEEAVEERGDGFVYGEHYDGDSCQYLEEDGDGGYVTGCIAGNALHRLGVPLTVLLLMDMAGPEGGSEVIGADKTIKILENAGFRLNEDALIPVAVAQREQDAGLPWGRAVRRAISTGGTTK